jgi:Cu/Ag efflux protein CusF
MRLYKVILLVNLALGAGFLLSSLWWEWEVGRLRSEIATAKQTTSARPSGERHWSVEGIVRVVAPEINRIFIDHGDIPGLMEAMTMAFEPEEPSLLNGLKGGDRVRFTLQEKGKRILLVAIEKEPNP